MKSKNDPEIQAHIREQMRAGNYVEIAVPESRGADRSFAQEVCVAQTSAGMIGGFGAWSARVDASGRNKSDVKLT